MNTDREYMWRCFQLAQLGAGKVSPNPLVGSVIVHNERIIGEGYHIQYGCPHAEVNAIDSVKDKSLLPFSTLYVNLEPCCHWGKTPPCAERIVKEGIKKVVIANSDSNPKVCGGGIKILKDNNIKVTTGVLEDEGRFLNRRFFTYQEKKRPYIIFKWAETIDGFMDTDHKSTKQWITNDILRVWTHKQRAENDAVLVGFNTILNDNPQLNVRYYFGKNPKRITVVRKNSLNKNICSKFNFFDKSQPTAIYETSSIEEVINSLYEDKITSIIVEGGRKTLDKFIELNLWDEATVLTGNKIFNSGLKAPVLNGKYTEQHFGDNHIRFYFNKN
ncbi:MAG: bifunctional diaminohydroxyphosphoribosylaminopyrimidine deaminase/5-amino-6-(5-phosphoribosylamino)uracil reductase RibD [Bacteroidales bacterium]|jgi:diaminohydroxyphosphoribosylaminopyrimidine deaminase/5-amino-6-(5-phosphoribosylamino)uracil reductase|nr:bifunctional diaminohydroxyphosphoribosylaminopyrimidine deaminase/5-amino-6-(5-phosphoribosylamino)uracil reductase RibD [Bacteroidales bacterium]